MTARTRRGEAAFRKKTQRRAMRLRPARTRQGLLAQTRHAPRGRISRIPAVQALFAVVREALAEGLDVRLPGLGVLKVRDFSARQGRSEEKSSVCVFSQKQDFRDRLPPDMISPARISDAAPYNR